MSPISRRLRRHLPAVLMLLAATTSARTEPVPQAKHVQYPVYFLGETEARMILEEKIPEGLPQNPNHVRWLKLPPDERSKAGPKGYLLVTAPASVQALVASTLKAYDVPSPTLTFRVHVLEFSRTGDIPVALPPAERKALQDFASVMPFKGFHLLHSARIEAEEQGYARFGSDFTLLFRFEASREPVRPVQFKSFRLGRLSNNANAAILETSFSMLRGETYVLGSSQVQAGGFLVLVTIEK